MVSKFLGALAMVLFAVAFLVTLYFGYQALTSRQRGLEKAASVEAAHKVVASQAQAGHEAVKATQAQAAFEATIRAQGHETKHIIAAAPGAEVPVVPSVYDAALREHCKRESAKHDPACLALKQRGS